MKPVSLAWIRLGPQQQLAEVSAENKDVLYINLSISKKDAERQIQTDCNNRTLEILFASLAFVIGRIFFF